MKNLNMPLLAKIIPIESVDLSSHNKERHALNDRHLMGSLIQTTLKAKA